MSIKKKNAIDHRIFSVFHLLCLLIWKLFKVLLNKGEHHLNALELKITSLYKAVYKHLFHFKIII